MTILAKAVCTSLANGRLEDSSNEDSGTCSNLRQDPPNKYLLHTLGPVQNSSGLIKIRSRARVQGVQGVLEERHL